MLEERGHALRIAGIYLLVGFLWILVSDVVLFALFPNPQTYHMAQSFKGWLYVLVTSATLYGLIRWRMQVLVQAAQTISAAYAELQATHEELVTTETELRYQKDLAEHIVDDAPSIIVLWSLDGSIEELNPYGQTLLEADASGDNLRMEDLLGESITSLRERLQTSTAVRSELGRWQVPSGRSVFVLWNSRQLSDSHRGEPRVISVGTDITERRELEQRLHRLAYYDALTQLPNRQLIHDVMDQWITLQKPFTLVVLDMDHFQDINDTLGHDAGDAFLEHAAQQLTAITSGHDVLGRIGGDEFGFLWFNVTDAEVIQRRIDRVFDVFGAWAVGDHEFMMTFSAGAACYPDHGQNSSDLFKNCDTALNDAKKHGRGRCKLYSQDIQDRNVAAIRMSSAIRRALENQEFELYYQPYMDLESQTIIGAEALIRWPQPDGGFISPPDFVPLAEDTGQIYDIDRWVIQEALNEMQYLTASGFGQLFLSINVSSRTVNQPEALEDLANTISNSPVNPQRVILEVTETALLDTFSAAPASLQRLSDLGVHLALDDFGTGYSSLEYISNWPIKMIKLDRSFINNIGLDEKKEAVITSVLQLAASLQYTVVAEGIETEEQWKFLTLQGCRRGQGFLFHRPLPKDQWHRLVATELLSQ